MEIDDKELAGVLEVANDAATNGSRNGRAVARRVIGVLAPLLMRSVDPRLKALGLALNLGSAILLGRKTKKVGAK